MAWMDDVGREGVDGWMDGWCGMGWLFWRCLEVRIERGDRGGGRGVVDGREGEEGNFKGPSWVESWLRVRVRVQCNAVYCNSYPYRHIQKQEKTATHELPSWRDS